MWLGCLLLAILPTDEASTTRCTTIEVNHVHDAEYAYHFSQIILWDDCECLAWRMLPKSARPRYRWATGEWESEWVENGEVIRIRAAAYRETWSTYDREMLERDYWPECKRRGLVRRKK